MKREVNLFYWAAVLLTMAYAGVSFWRAHHPKVVYRLGEEQVALSMPACQDDTTVEWSQEHGFHCVPIAAASPATTNKTITAEHCLPLQGYGGAMPCAAINETANTSTPGTVSTTPPTWLGPAVSSGAITMMSTLTDDWRPISTAPKDGTVVEVKETYGVAPWYGLYHWKDDFWRSVADPMMGVAEDEHLFWRPFSGDPAHYVDPTGGAQNSNAYWCAAMHVTYDPKTGFCKEPK